MSNTTLVHPGSEFPLASLIFTMMWCGHLAEVAGEHETGILYSGIALVAHGGTRRRDLAPYSDADLMLLTTQASSPLAEKFSQLSRDLVDAGLDVGFSIRMQAEACDCHGQIRLSTSSLTEIWNCGSDPLQVYSRFFE